VDLEVVCAPKPDYARGAPEWEYLDDGCSSGVARMGGKNPDPRLSSDLRCGLHAQRARARTRLEEGQTHFVALAWSSLPAPATWDEALEKMWRTEQFWRDWITQGSFPDHPWRIFLQRSALTLKGLTYAPTGALLAAATTSLP